MTPSNPKPLSEEEIANLIVDIENDLYDLTNAGLEIADRLLATIRAKDERIAALEGEVAELKIIKDDLFKYSREQERRKF